MTDPHSEARIPLSLVTGFLGTGKTTFLKHTARRLADRRIVYLVNDFSSVDVDGPLLREVGPDVVSVAGGSIFCKCLVGEFIEHLSAIPRRFHAPGQPVEGVLIEASGIADPKVVQDMLGQTRLDAIYDLAAIVAIVDPGSLHKLLATLPNIRSQIEAADLVLLNKIDLFDEPTVAACEAMVRQVRPQARVIRTVRCEVDLDLFGRQPARQIHGEYAGCADPHYSQYGVPLNRPVDLAKLQAALQEIREDLYRAKGFVLTPSGRVYLDWSVAGVRVQPQPAPAGREQIADAPPSALAILARGGNPVSVLRLIMRIRRGEFDSVPAEGQAL